MRVTMSRRGLLAGTAAGLLTASCTQDSPDSGEKLRIGWIAPQQGTYRGIGDEMTGGLGLYLEAAGHELGGRSVELLTVDEGVGVKRAAKAAKELLEDGDVVALAGIADTDSYAEIAAIAQDKKVPLIGAGDRPDLNPSRLQWLWHVSWISSEPGTAIASYVRQQKAGSVYAIGPETQVGVDQLSGFVETFTEQGGTLANSGSKPQWTAFPDTKDFSAYLSEAASSGADAIYAYYVGDAAVNFVADHAASAAKDIPLYGAFITEGTVLTEQGKAAEGVMTVLNYSSDLDNVANRTFVAEWQAAHKRQPNIYAVCAWDVAQVLDGAIGNIPAGTKVTPSKINTAISELGAIDSPRGSWRFSKSTHSPIQRWYLREVQQDGTRLANIVIQELETLGG